MTMRKSQRTEQTDSFQLFAQYKRLSVLAYKLLSMRKQKVPSL
jgi:hypothetical protein